MVHVAHTPKEQARPNGPHDGPASARPRPPMTGASRLDALRLGMARFAFLIALALLCGLSIYQTEVRLLQSAPATRKDVRGRDPFHLVSSEKDRSRAADDAGAREMRRELRVVHWSGKDDLKGFMRAYFDSENPLCRHVLDDNEAADPRPVDYLFNVTFGCRNLFETAGLGSGNFLAGLYAMRLAARALAEAGAGDRTVRVRVHCDDAAVEQAHLLLPWLVGDFRFGANGAGVGRGAHSNTAQTMTRRLFSEPESFLEAACKNIDQAPIGLLFKEMQYELRRMAVRLVGVPPHDHAMHATVQHWIAAHGDAPSPDNQYLLPFHPEDAPLYRNVSLDDAVLHFRCGDLMDSNHPRFGFLRFRAFADRIPATARSIGIVTQPFDGSSDTVRALDASATKRERCRIVVKDFIHYLRERFPEARVQLHNSPDETIALTYARLIMAQSTVAAISTFGVFASIASFGTGYIRRPDERSATNGWLLHPRPLDEIMAEREPAGNHAAPQLVLMDEPDVLMVRQVKKLWLKPDGQERILQWFRGEG